SGSGLEPRVHHLATTTVRVNKAPVKKLDICLVSDLGLRFDEMSCPAGVAKKALRGDDLGTPVAKKGFRSDGSRGRFARGLAKAQVTNGLFSAKEIIHLAIVTARALFGHTSSLPRPFLASALPNPSPRNHFLAIRANFALGGDNPKGPW
ncbi:MAG: hypothetical protein PUD02_07240, partial [Eggerthellales bacterium]|nr:hypothetical protein [Eggerthellales bacterium]